MLLCCALQSSCCYKRDKIFFPGHVEEIQSVKFKLQNIIAVINEKRNKWKRNYYGAV